MSWRKARRIGDFGLRASNRVAATMELFPFAGREVIAMGALFGLAARALVARPAVVACTVV